MHQKVTLILVSLILLLLPGQVYSDVEMTVIKELDLNVQPLDVASSADGQMLYVLTSGEILVYSYPDMRIVNRIPVDSTFDGMTLSSRDNTLILTSSTGKILKIVQLDFVREIDISGLPFKGARDAPVTIAVFSDYQ